MGPQHDRSTPSVNRKDKGVRSKYIKYNVFGAYVLIAAQLRVPHNSLWGMSTFAYVMTMVGKADVLTVRGVTHYLFYE